MVTKLIINTQTNEGIQQAVTDAQIIASGGYYLELSWDGSTNTLSAQIKSKVLSDGSSRANISETQTWLLQIGDVEEAIETDVNGAWSDTITFEDSAQYSAYAITPNNSNEVTIQDGV